MTESREYVRNIQTGDRGFIVERPDGAGKLVKFFKRDLGPHADNPLIPESLERFDKDTHVPDVDKRPLSRGTVGRMLYELDHALCTAIGIRTEKDWLLVPEQVRVKWCHGQGPKEPPVRRELFEMNFKYLSEFVK